MNKYINPEKFTKQAYSLHNNIASKNNTEKSNCAISTTIHKKGKNPLKNNIIHGES
jgi:hypothetical protein